MKLYFSDFFEVAPAELRRYGAFNISLVSDLPLFIDPFLLFNSRKPEYRALHDRIIEYLRFLKDKSINLNLDPGLIKSLYRFPEVYQNWLGFTVSGNKGSGLGQKFATALHRNLNRLFSDFGTEKLTKGSHLEKLCLIESGVGRDNISDFTTNLIKGYLLKYTQTFARQFIRKDLRKRFLVEKVHFNYVTETWEAKSFVLPVRENDYVLLTPRNMLTKDDTWISRSELVGNFDMVREALPDEQLRAQINNYLKKVLPKRPTARQRHEAAAATIYAFPQIIDAFIKEREDHGQWAQSISMDKVRTSEHLYLRQFGELVNLLSEKSSFYQFPGRTYAEALTRVRFLKDVIENKGGHKIFYLKGRALERESDAHILYRLTWFASPSKVHREVNDGRGPADFVVSEGSKDTSIVEFKLASNPQLEKNLRHQTKTYERASDASKSIRVILYFSKAEQIRVEAILKRLKLSSEESVVLIDARNDNKPSGSKAA
jgi:hypothetical protein